MKKSIVMLLFSCWAAIGLSQQKSTLSGFMKDESSGEELIGATIFIDSLKIGVVANVYGFYSITVPKGIYSVKFSYIGYQTIIKEIDLTENVKLDIELPSESTQLDEVEVVSTGANDNVKEVEMSVNKMEMKTIERIPALLGEVDVIRSIQLLPGVTTVGEGASGFNVRGGSIDQNLVLLDEAPVYNSSHLFGFFSVFNPDAVKNVKLVKGGIPAQYGGRLSSLLDVRMKEGNLKKFAGSGGVGAIFSRLTLEGPIAKNKASFIVAGRRSYIDVLAKPFLKGDLKDAKFFFYDLTAKVNYKPSEKDRLFLSGYLGRDVFGGGFTFNWGNSTATARWNHIFSDKLFMNLTGFYSNYDYELGFGEEGVDAFNWNSNIINYSVKPELSYYLSENNTITFGGQTILYQFKPGEASFASNNVTNNISLEDKYSLEHAIYIGNEQKTNGRFAFTYGLRLSMYQYIGPGTSYQFGEPDQIGSSRPMIGSEEHEKAEVIKTYMNPEPRFAVKMDLDEQSSLKASYNRTAQYIHLVSNTAASTPLDVWTSSTNNIKPQLADQVALGYFRNFNDNKIETSLEVYYKTMDNQLDYVRSAELLLNEFVEGELIQGEGRAYGLELYLRRKTGKLNGWISYTLSRTERHIEGISNNDWFPNRFDKPHVLNLVANYDLNDRIVFSANFVFSSGTPSTFPTNRIDMPTLGFAIPHNSEETRNNYRVPDYHRVDLSATIYGKKKENKKWEGNWVFSVYNVYNRRNPYTIFFKGVESEAANTSVPYPEARSFISKTQAIQYSVVGSFIPSVTYNFKF